MSADSAQQDLEANPEDLPDVGVRSRKQYSHTIHRRREVTDEPRPACREDFRDARFKTCNPASLIVFARWSLCQNPECFGQHDDSDDVNRGDGPLTDGGLNPDDLDCLAWHGAERCPNDPVKVVDGVPLCNHHAERADIYDYPKTQHLAGNGEVHCGP